MENECCHFVPSRVHLSDVITKPTCEAKVSNTSPAKKILLSIGKSKSALWSSNLTQKGVLLFLWDNVCVWVHVCVCVCLCVCMLHMSVHAQICMHTCVCVRTSIHIYVCAQMHVYLVCFYFLMVFFVVVVVGSFPCVSSVLFFFPLSLFVHSNQQQISLYPSVQ